METSNTNIVASTCAHTNSVRAVGAQFASRGLVKAVTMEAAEQKSREEKTAMQEPLAYRMYAMTEGAVVGLYKKGKNHMSSADLIAYIRETRAIRTRDVDFSVAPAMDEQVCTGDAEKQMVIPVKTNEGLTMTERIRTLPSKFTSLPARAIQKMRTGKNVWFDTAKQDTSRESKRFPLSAFAMLAAIAVSLMLIVASTVMVHHGERAVNDLTLTLSQMSNEVAELKSDLNVHNDLLSIREIAVNEFGMVSEEYIRMNYISAEKGDTIEAFKAEEEERVGLGALLSAIGIK